MGLLDGILGNVVGSVLGGGGRTQTATPLDTVLQSLAGGGQAQQSGLLSAAMSLVQGSGGLTGILDMFRGSGMAAQADSWVSTGPNMAVSPEQVRQAVGGTALSGIASQLGMTSDQAGSAMARILPELVNQLTPEGSVPDNHGDLVSQALSMLRGGRA